MKKAYLAILLLAGLSLASCEESHPESTTNKIQVDKHGSCLIQLGQVDSSNYTIISFSDSVYDKKGNLLKVFNHIDTIPTLGMITDTLETDQTYEDENGDTYYKDTTFRHIQPYQLFINVSKK